MTRIVLDPGHGGAVTLGGATPDGARGPGGLREKHLTLALARAVADRLRDVAHVELTRDADTSLALADRRARARDADAFVSLHFNADPDPRVQGHETWHHEHAPEPSRALARDLHAALLTRIGHPDRGVQRGPLTVLDPRDLGSVPACLLELSYLSDPAEAARLAGPDHLARLADAVAHGLRARLGAAPAVDIWHEVPLVPQLTGMSCWAAAAAMLIGWRDCIAVDPAELARGSGRWHEYQIGIEPRDITTLARIWDLDVVDVPPDLSFADLAALLEQHGPLWVGEASPGLHVVVVAGAHGDGHPDRSHVRIADPWPAGRGERYTIPFTEFRRSLAAAAALSADSAKLLHNHRGRARARRTGDPTPPRPTYARLAPGPEDERYPDWTA